MRTLSALIPIFLLIACQPDTDSVDSQVVATANNGISLDVYKSETCGCCGIWTEYMEKLGYQIRIHHPNDLNAIKEQYDIAPQWQSCHTAVAENGYFFEGHIPEKHVRSFLETPPENAAGLVVPGMPLGSPGMAVGDRFTPYDIVLQKNDGSTEIYANIKTLSDQY